MSDGTEFGRLLAPDTLRFERLLPGPIERVWTFLTEPEKRGLWLAGGSAITGPGSEFELRFDHRSLAKDPLPTPEPFRSLDAGHLSCHRVTRFEPPHLLAFTWSDGAEGESEVTIELAKQGADVRLVLTHRKLAAQDALLNTAGGWHTHLGILEERLRGSPPAPFWPRFMELKDLYEERIAPGPKA